MSDVTLDRTAPLPLHLRPRATAGAPHVRDGVSVRRLVNVTVLALVPCILAGVHETGRQANLAMAASGTAQATGWRGALLDALGVGYDPASASACVLHGFVWLLPVSLVTVGVGACWQSIFARVRGVHAAELVITGLLFALFLPPTIPLWQAAAGITFGIVVGKEVFGGTGKNFLNPALAGLAFVYFAYPASLRSAPVWVASDGWSGTTPMALAASGGVAALRDAGVTWLDTFWGREPGAMGETSAAACLVGAMILLWVRVVSWRVLAGGVAGVIATAVVFERLAPAGLPMATLPWHWHLTLGGFAFGLVFFATDPVTAATTNPGRWCYGVLIGCMTVIIRVANPAHTDGVLLAILLGNVFAPLIDYAVVWRNARRRERRGA